MADELIVASASSGTDYVFMLRPAIGAGEWVVVAKVDPNPHNVIVVPDGTDTINGSAGSDTISTQWAIIRYVDYAPGKWAKW